MAISAPAYTTNKRTPRLGVWLLFLAFCWTTLIAGLVWLDYRESCSTVLAIAGSTAGASIDKDLLYRRWASVHSSASIPVSAETPPNPNLSKVSEKDFATPSEKMNPASMPPQGNELGNQQPREHGHITSLKPRKPENAPDEWEKGALLALQEGKKEVSSLDVRGNDYYFRLMRPLVVERSCLTCHAAQGHKEGDVCGGLSISVPWATSQEAVNASISMLLITYGGIWIIGILGLSVFQNRLRCHLLNLKQAEKAAAAQSLRNEVLLQTSSDGIHVIDEQGNVVEASNTFCQMLGYTRDELLLLNVADWDVQWSPTELITKIRMLIGSPRIFETRHRTKDGRIIEVEINARGVALENHIYLYASVRDITERKRIENELKESEERHRMLFEQSRDAMMIMAAPSWRFTTGNPATLALFGVKTADEFSALGPWDISPERQPGGRPSAEKAQEMIETALREGSHFFEWMHQRLDGATIPCTVLLTRMSMAGQVFVQATVRDITERRQAEKIRQEALNRLQKIASRVPGLVYQYQLRPDGSGCMPFASEAIRELFRVSPEDVREDVSKLFANIHPDDYIDVGVSIQKSARDLTPWQHEFRVKFDDGTIRSLHGNSVPQREEDGSVLWHGFIIDITERKEMERCQKLSAEVLGILNDPHVLSDAISRILAAIQRTTGFDAVGIRLRNGDDFPYYSQNGFSADFLRVENTLTVCDKAGGLCRDNNGNISLECTCGLVLSGQTDPASPLFTAGGSFWTNNSLPLLELTADQDPRLHPRNRCIHEGFCSVALIPIRADHKIVGLLQLNDRNKDRFTHETIHFYEGISASIGAALMRKRAEDDLLHAKAELQEYAAVLESSNQALKESNQIAESATRAKSDFLANMSHEIRTPMTAILGYADILLEESTGRASCEHVKVIKRNGEHLLGLINDILDLSKVEAGKMQIEPICCSPFDLLAEVASLMRVRATAKHLRLEIEQAGPLPETILTDPLRLRQVLVNLVGNAIKFTDQGEIRIAVRLTDDSGHARLRFDVTDTGIGMNEEQLGGLFQAFSQVDNSSARKFGGTGLGLCISKRLTAAMGGKIEVHSAPGKGSTFSVTIDPGPLDGIRMIQNSQEALLEHPPTPTAANPDEIKLSGRILLAEDGPDNQRLIAFVLRKAGAEVTLAENGQIAYDEAKAALAQGTPFDVILMDMQMPVMDGYEATRRLRSDGYTGPIIALTAHAMTEDRRKCIDAGCDDFGTKPINRQVLLTTVAHWMAPGRTTELPKLVAVPTASESNTISAMPSTFIYSQMAADPDFGELVDLFVQEMPDRINALETQAQSRDWQQLTRTAHQMKGAAGSYGFNEITPSAARLEAAARDGSQEEDILSTLDELLSLCRQVRSGAPQGDETVLNAANSPLASDSINAAERNY